jgi:hypothetical protein
MSGAARLVPSVSTLLTLSLFAATLVSCGGAPDVVEPGLDDPESASTAPQGKILVAGAPAKADAEAGLGTGKTGDARSAEPAEEGESGASGPVLFSVREGAKVGSPAVDVRSGPEVRDTPQSHALETWPDGSLITELESRWSRQWSDLPGGIGGMDDDPRREKLATRLLAIGFLRSPEAEPPRSIEEALAYARATLREPQHKLMAAAFLEGAGRRVEAVELIAEVSGGIGAPLAEAPRAERFKLENLAFARTIEGPGKYTVLEPEDLRAGKTVLVYGEFRNFRSVLDSRGETPVHHRAFAASLKLLKESGEEVDRLDFLPEGRGYQAAGDPGAIVNFWARYRLPQSLAPGKYKLVVEGKDLLAGAQAISEQALEIR